MLDVKHMIYPLKKMLSFALLFQKSLYKTGKKLTLFSSKLHPNPNPNHYLHPSQAHQMQLLNHTID